MLKGQWGQQSRWVLYWEQWSLTDDVLQKYSGRVKNIDAIDLHHGNKAGPIFSIEPPGDPRASGNSDPRTVSQPKLFTKPGWPPDMGTKFHIPLLHPFRANPAKALYPAPFRQPVSQHDKN